MRQGLSGPLGELDHPGDGVHRPLDSLLDHRPVSLLDSLLDHRPVSLLDHRPDSLLGHRLELGYEDRHSPIRYVFLPGPSRQKMYGLLARFVWRDLLIRDLSVCSAWGDRPVVIVWRI
jgi:hypothetical protein